MAWPLDDLWDFLDGAYGANRPIAKSLDLYAMKVNTERFVSMRKAQADESKPDRPEPFVCLRLRA